MSRVSNHEERAARRAHVALKRDIEREHRHKARRKLVSLREHVRAARLARRNALLEVTTRCRSERIAVRERTRLERLQALQALRETLHAERQAARDACSLRRDEAKKATSDAIERARAELSAERKYQEDLRRIEHGNRERRRGVHRSTSTERRSESDDEVRANIPPELVSLFEKVKRGVRASLRESRTEAFLRYAEEHPDEVLRAIDDKTDAVIRELEHREREAARHYRRRNYTAAELAEVPF
jgi:hypothetical protein